MALLINKVQKSNKTKFSSEITAVAEVSAVAITDDASFNFRIILNQFSSFS